MRRALLVAALVAAAAAPGSAGATPAPEGAGCRFSSVNATGPTTWTGELSSSPVAAPGATAVTVTCEVHVGNTTHNGPAVVTETSITGPGATALEPRVITYQAEDWEIVAVCTRATVDGAEWYLVESGWSGSPGSCLVPLGGLPNPDLPPPLDEAEPLVGYVRCLSSRTTCDLLQTVDQVFCDDFADAPPGVPGVVELRDDGDIYLAGELFWDCPPYQW